MKRKLKWVTKNGVQKKAQGYDVSISITEHGAYITFRNDCSKRITKGEHFIFAVDGNRIYFDGAECKEGYKLTKKQSKTTTYTNIQKECGRFKRFVGDYDLKYDNEEKLSYIERV